MQSGSATGILQVYWCNILANRPRCLWGDFADTCSSPNRIFSDTEFYMPRDVAATSGRPVECDSSSGRRLDSAAVSKRLQRYGCKVIAEALC